MEASVCVCVRLIGFAESWISSSNPKIIMCWSEHTAVVARTHLSAANKILFLFPFLFACWGFDAICRLWFLLDERRKEKKRNKKQREKQQKIMEMLAACINEMFDYNSPIFSSFVFLVSLSPSYRYRRIAVVFYYLFRNRIRSAWDEPIAESNGTTKNRIETSTFSICRQQQINMTNWSQITHFENKKKLLGNRMKDVNKKKKNCDRNEKGIRKSSGFN